MSEDTRISSNPNSELTLTVVTFNIRHALGLDDRVDLDRIADTLRPYSPDVVALQEIESRNPRSGLIDQPVLLAEKLRMNGYFAPNWSVGPIGRFGNAILSRHPLHSTWNKFLTSRGERRGLAHACLWLADRDINVYCTHWGLKSEERLLQAEECFWQFRRDAGTRSILCGDLNSQAGSQEVARVSDVAGWQLADPAEVSFPANAPEVRIDHVSASHALRIDHVQTIPSDASDHLPVLVRLTVVE